MAWSKNTDKEVIRKYQREYYQRKTKDKRKKQRELNKQKKVCAICGTTFMPDRPNVKYCCDACKLVASKIRAKLYRTSEKGKETAKKYRQTEVYKETRKRYLQSEKGKAALKKYMQSEKGKLATQKSREKAKENSAK